MPDNSTIRSNPPAKKSKSFRKNGLSIRKYSVAPSPAAAVINALCFPPPIAKPMRKRAVPVKSQKTASRTKARTVPPRRRAVLSAS